MVNRVFPFGHPESSDPTSHFLPTRDAAKMVRDLREHPAPHTLLPFHHISFHGLAVQALLNQPGAEGIQWSLAAHDGRLTLVGFAVDKEGNIVGTDALQNGHPCPPLC